MKAQNSRLSSNDSFCRSAVRAGRLLPVFAFAVAVACSSNDNPPESSPGTGSGETITGRERLGWDQAASSAAELSSYRFAIYVDGTRSDMIDVTCASSSGSSGFACSGRLPSMSNGSHVLELATITANGTLESGRSAQLRVIVAASTTPVGAQPLTDGERITTLDGVQLDASLVARDLADIVDVAIASDGRFLVAQRDGRVTILGGNDEAVSASVASGDGKLLALALAPDFARSGHVYVIQAQQAIFRLIRHRLLDGQLVERMAVLPDVPASADPSALLRFGPDGKLYAAFDDGGDRASAARLFEWSGKILRLNPDGTTPDDQPAASPVMWSNIGSPGGLDWPREGRGLWVAETGVDGVERLRALFSGGERPRRVGQRSAYVLPPPVDATSLAFYRGEQVRELRDDLFITARKGSYLLRVRFDPTDSSRVASTEKLLEGRLGEPRAVAASADGALFVATRDNVWRLTPVGNQR
jgi:glucose/arabinose dehydrogenase